MLNMCLYRRIFIHAVFIYEDMDSHILVMNVITAIAV